MTKLYAVHGGSSIYSVVKANSEEEAFDIFAENQMDDEYLVEHITDFAVNAGLLEKFYRDNAGHFFDSLTGDYQERLSTMNEEEQKRYIDGWIKKNTLAFWNDQPQFADEYINELNKSRESDDYYMGQFSKAFMIDTIKRLVSGGKWYEGFGIEEIDLTSSDYQLIYRE